MRCFSFLGVQQLSIMSHEVILGAYHNFFFSRVFRVARYGWMCLHSIHNIHLNIHVPSLVDTFSSIDSHAYDFVLCGHVACIVPSKETQRTNQSLQGPTCTSTELGSHTVPRTFERHAHLIWRLRTSPPFWLANMPRIFLADIRSTY